MTVTATLLINLHREGILAGRTIRHAVEAAMRLKQLSQQDMAVLVVLDRPDANTLELARSFETQNLTIHVVDFGNLGKARQFGVARIDTKIIFFLDGDDLVSYNWFPDAIRYLQDPAHVRHICHTNYFVGFGEDRFIRLGVDSRDPGFSSVELALDWFFCNNLACRKDVFDVVPLSGYDHSIGIGAEDWHWSAETIAHGFSHVVLPGTSYFYRTKPSGLSLGNAGEFLPWPSAAWKHDFSDNVEHVEFTREKYLQLLDSVGPSGFIGAVRNAAAELCSIEPSISYLLEEQGTYRIVVPRVDLDCLEVFNRLNKQLHQKIFIADPDDFPGNWVGLVNFIDKLSGGDSYLVLVDNASLPDEAEWSHGRLVNFKNIAGDWQAQHHAARIMGRLTIDSRPSHICIFAGKRLVEWLSKFSLQVSSFAEKITVVNAEPAVDPLSLLSYHDVLKAFPTAEYLHLSPIAAEQARNLDWQSNFDSSISLMFYKSICPSDHPVDKTIGSAATYSLDSLTPRRRTEHGAKQKLDSEAILISPIDDPRRPIPLDRWDSEISQPSSRFWLASHGRVEVSASLAKDLLRPNNQIAMKQNAVLLFRQIAVQRRDRSLVMYRNEHNESAQTMSRLLSQRVLIVSLEIVQRTAIKLRTATELGLETDAWSSLLIEICEAGAPIHVLYGDTVAMLEENKNDQPIAKRIKLLREWAE